MNNLLLLVSVFALTTSSAIANEVHDRLIKMNDPERGKMLSHILHDSKKKCGTSNRTFFQGFDSDKAAYWNVACSSGKDFAIQIPENVNANTRIMECDMMKLLEIDCFKKLK